MIYKVLYQKDSSEIAVRENTESMYIEADSEMDVRIKLKDRPYNIEFVQPVSDALLAFEKQKKDFKVENI